MKGLILVDPVTGERENCGAITRRRTIDNVPMWLTYDEVNHMWWIVWQDDCLHKAGYVENRREVCWQTFLKMTASDLAKLRPS